MVESIQHGGGISSIRWKIFSKDMSHHQYGEGESLIRWRAYSVDCHIGNTEEGVQ